MQGRRRAQAPRGPERTNFRSIDATHVDSLRSSSQVSGRRTLEHSTRRRLYDHLLILPGDHFRSIARCLGLGVGTARHHLKIMVRNGVVYERKTDGRCRYYIAGDQAQLERNDMFGKHWGFRDLRIRIRNVLVRNGESTAAKIGSVLGITRQLASYHLSRLEGQGLVTSEKSRYRVKRSSGAATDRIEETARNS